jgi:hypothetical protein
LGQCAEQNWRKLRGFDYLAKVITGIRFKDGIETVIPPFLTGCGCRTYAAIFSF